MKQKIISSIIIVAVVAISVAVAATKIRFQKQESKLVTQPKKANGMSSNGPLINLSYYNFFQ